MNFLTWLPLVLVFVLLAFRIPVCAAFISGAVVYFTFIAPYLQQFNPQNTPKIDRKY